MTMCMTCTTRGTMKDMAVLTSSELQESIMGLVAIKGGRDLMGGEDVQRDSWYTVYRSYRCMKDVALFVQCT